MDTGVKAEVKEKVGKIIFQGMEKDECIMVNEALFKHDENLKTNTKAVEYFQDQIDRLKTELWFIKSSKCKTKADVEKYKVYQENQIKLTKQSLEQLEGRLAEQKEQLEEINDLINEWYDNIQMKELKSGDRVAIYNPEYFRPLIKFSAVIGYIDYNAIKKKQEKKQETESKTSERKSNNVS